MAGYGSGKLLEEIRRGLSLNQRKMAFLTKQIPREKSGEDGDGRCGVGDGEDVSLT